MQNLQKLSWLHAAFLFALILTLSDKLQAEEVRVGVILGLSGGVSAPAYACQNGMKMAFDSLDAETQKALKLIYEDDQNQPKLTVSSFSKLLGSDSVDAVVTFSSGTSKAVAPLAEQRGIPLLAIASDPAVIRGRKHAFNFWVAPREEVKELIPELKARGIKRIARISTTHDGTLAIKDAFDEVNQGQVEIVVDEDYPQEATDFRTFIAKLQSRDLDGIFVNLYFGMPGLFTKQLRENGIGLPLFNVETFEDKQQVEMSKGAMIGGVYAQADDPSGSFVAEYEKRFPGASSYTAANCHDLVLLFGKAIGEGKTSPAQITAFMHSVTDFSGAMGTYSSTGDNLFSLPATLKVITKQGFALLSDEKAAS